MPKLLLINTTLNSGSTGRITEQISALAETQGWDCYLAHGGRYINKSKFKTIQIRGKLDNVVHAVLGEFLGLHGFGSYLATKRFVKTIKKVKPDVIHLHNIHGYYLNIKVLFDYLAEADIPVVWTLHDCWSFTGHCTHFEKEGCYKWKTDCGNCPLLMAQYKSRLFDRSKKNLNIKKSLYAKQKNLIITPVSQWLGNLLSKSILKQHRIQVINNGIDLKVFNPTLSNLKKRLNIPEGNKRILGVVASGFGEEKGRTEFLEYSKNPEWQIVIVGLSDEDKRDIPDNIICINRTNSQEELAEFYSAADVFVNPTYNESLGLTNIEANACGTPVVTYKAGGSPETIDTTTGIVVARGDIEGMKNAIQLVLSKGKAEYLLASRKRVERLYNKNDRFMDYIKLYDELISK